MDMTTSPAYYSWCEGKKDEGIGEGVTIELYEPTQIDHITLAPGVQRTEKLFAKNNQITKITVSVDDKSQTMAITPRYGATIDVKIGAKVTKLGIKIAAVTKGQDNDSCFSEVTIASPGAAEVSVPLVVGISPAAWGKLGPVLDALIKKQAPNGDPDDERGYRVEGKGPGIVTITFPAHSDTLDQWTMEWKNEKWTRKSIGKEEW